MDYLTRAKKFRTKKRLGQNFLIDEHIINTIINEAGINKSETIIEIGPGVGFVTEQLAQKAEKVIAIELDEQAAKVIKKLPFENIEIIQQDVLTVDFSQIIDKPAKIVANIPYYITSPILSHILGEIDQRSWRNRELTSELTLMVQHEVARRLVADENSKAKEYGLLSILVNYWCKTELICKVPADSFWPAPRVDSALVRLTLREEPLVHLQNPSLFRQVTQAAFGMRRKTIKNALEKQGFDPHAVEAAGIDPGRRGETLSIQEFNEITRFL